MPKEAVYTKTLIFKATPQQKLRWEEYMRAHSLTLSELTRRALDAYTADLDEVRRKRALGEKLREQAAQRGLSAHELMVTLLNGAEL